MRSDDELRLEMAISNEITDRVDAADPTSWPKLDASIAEMERENPKLRDREYILDTATKFVTDKLNKGPGLRHPSKWYRDRLNRMILQYPRPMLLVATIGFMFDNIEDPTDFIDDAARMADLATEQWPHDKGGQ
jgi:hypothetical protein